MYDDTQQYVDNVQALRSRFGGRAGPISGGSGLGPDPRHAVQGRSTVRMKFTRGAGSVPRLAP